jgi:hypothetical protein
MNRTFLATIQPYITVILLAALALGASVAGFFLRGTSITTDVLVQEINDRNVTAMTGYLDEDGDALTVYLTAEIDGYDGEVLIDTVGSARDPLTYLIDNGANRGIITEIPFDIVEEDAPHNTLERQLGTVLLVGGVLAFVAVAVGGTYFAISARERRNREAMTMEA